MSVVSLCLVAYRWLIPTSTRCADSAAGSVAGSAIGARTGIAAVRGAVLAGLVLSLFVGCSAQRPAGEGLDQFRVQTPASDEISALTGIASPGEESAPPLRIPPTSPNREEAPFTDLHELDPYLEGIASWYGPGFHGRSTANGEIYNQLGLTAAHPLLPMGTRIEVTNLLNGHRVWVRINDRGPFKDGRIVDLSRLAAERLGMIRPGTVPVKIEVVHWPDNVDPELGLRAYRQFVVQVAAHPDPAEAEIRRQKFAVQAPWAQFRVDHPAGGAFSVVTPPFENEPAAREAASRLQRQGLTVLVRSYRK